MNDSHDEMVARDDAAKGEITAFINSLDKEQLSTFRQILIAVAQDTDIAWQIDGVASGCQIWKFGLTLNGKPTPWTVEDQGHSLDASNPPPPSGEFRLPTAEEEANGVAPEVTPNNRDEAMKMWEVEGDGGDRVKCIHCGYAHLSLMDRVRRPPGKAGCDGCKHKAAWGG